MCLRIQWNVCVHNFITWKNVQRIRQILGPLQTRRNIALDKTVHQSVRYVLSLLHTGDKVDCIGNKVERIGNEVDRDELPNSGCCQFVAKTSYKVKRISNIVERIQQQSTLLPVSATVDFQQSRPCWIQLCCQCVPGFTDTWRLMLQQHLKCNGSFQPHGNILVWVQHVSYWVNYMPLTGGVFELKLTEALNHPACLAINAHKWASGYASQHIPNWLPSRETGRVAAGRASGVKIPCLAWLGLLSLSSIWLLQASWWSYSERRGWEESSN